MKTFIVWFLFGIIAVNSIYVTATSRFTAGTLLMWLLSAFLLVYALFYRQIDAFTKAGLGMILKIACLAGAVIFAGLFIFVAVSGYTSTVKGDEKAIIVLGAGLKGENVSGVLARRLNAAIDAAKENPDMIFVVTGGQGKDEVIPEALAMQRYLIAHGILPQNIIIEDKSTSTEENLAFAQVLLEEFGISKNDAIAVATNSFHCYRARQYAYAAGFTNIRTIPASMDMMYVLPSYSREVLAILYFWVFKR